MDRGTAKLKIAIVTFIKIIGMGSRLFREPCCYNNLQGLNILDEWRLHYEIIDNTIKTCRINLRILLRIGFKWRVLMMGNGIVQDDLWRHAKSKNGKNENRTNLSYDKIVLHFFDALQFTDFNRSAIIFIGKRKPIVNAISYVLVMVPGNIPTCVIWGRK